MNALNTDGSVRIPREYRNPSPGGAADADAIRLPSGDTLTFGDLAILADACATVIGEYGTTRDPMPDESALESILLRNVRHSAYYGPGGLCKRCNLAIADTIHA